MRVDERFQTQLHFTYRITAALTRIDRARGFLKAATLSESWVREMGCRPLIVEAGHTPHIEGTPLTLEQAERLIAGIPIPEANPDDVRKVMNHREASELVSEVLSTCDRSFGRVLLSHDETEASSVA